MIKSTVVAVLVGLALVGGACSTGNIFSIDVGTCFNDDDGVTGNQEVTDVPIVECDGPHDNEVYAVFDVPDGDFPGAAALDEMAFSGCVERFDAFVGTAYLDSTLEVFPILPTEGSWDQGDREVVCALYDLTLTKLEGTMAGSER